MFLSKRGSIYYLWFVDQFGKRQEVSTHARTKAEAVQFLRAFKEEEQVRQVKRNRTTLSLFSQDYLKYSEPHLGQSSGIFSIWALLKIYTVGNKFISTMVLQSVTGAYLVLCDDYPSASPSDGTPTPARSWGL